MTTLDDFQAKLRTAIALHSTKRVAEACMVAEKKLHRWANDKTTPLPDRSARREFLKKIRNLKLGEASDKSAREEFLERKVEFWKGVAREHGFEGEFLGEEVIEYERNVLDPLILKWMKRWELTNQDVSGPAQDDLIDRISQEVAAVRRFIQECVDSVPVAPPVSLDHIEEFFVSRTHVKAAINTQREPKGREASEAVG
jgi:hypothetical protein